MKCQITSKFSRWSMCGWRKHPKQKQCTWALGNWCKLQSRLSFAAEWHLQFFHQSQRISASLNEIPHSTPNQLEFIFVSEYSEFIWIPVLSFFATLLSCYIPCFRSCPDQHLHLAYLVLSYLLLLDSMELDVTLTRHPQAQDVGGLSVEDLRSSVMCQPFDKTRQIRS